MALIKSISGIRGTIGGKPGESLTAIDVVKFTAAYGNIIAERREDKSHPAKIVLGRDGRISGTPQGSNVFVWMVSAIDYLDKPIFLKGTVTLIR